MDRLMMRFLVKFAIFWVKSWYIENQKDNAQAFVAEGQGLLDKEQFEFMHEDNSK